MTPVRPELLARLMRGREVIAAALVAALGLWFCWLGGYLLLPVGIGLLVLALAWGVSASRRLRFAQTVGAPGVVELDEAQIGYFGPEGGGFVSIQDLAELRLVRLRGRRVWQLRQTDGQTLLIPIDATGADRLFDAFASLPGLDSAALLAALAPQPASGSGLVTLTGASQTIWRRAARASPLLKDAP